VVGAGAARGAGHEEVVEAAAERLGGAVGVVEVDVDGLEVAAQRPLGPQRRVRPVGPHAEPAATACLPTPRGASWPPFRWGSWVPAAIQFLRERLLRAPVGSGRAGR